MHTEQVPPQSRSHSPRCSLGDALRCQPDVRRRSRFRPRASGRLALGLLGNNPLVRCGERVHSPSSQNRNTSWFRAVRCASKPRPCLGPLRRCLGNPGGALFFVAQLPIRILQTRPERLRPPSAGLTAPLRPSSSSFERLLSGIAQERARQRSHLARSGAGRRQPDASLGPQRHTLAGCKAAGREDRLPASSQCLGSRPMGAAEYTIRDLERSAHLRLDGVEPRCR